MLNTETLVVFVDENNGCIALNPRHVRRLGARDGDGQTVVYLVGEVDPIILKGEFWKVAEALGHVHKFGRDSYT